jgi:Holliday junction resolvase RusA-like endonuclease
VTSKGWTYYPRAYREWKERAALLIPDLLSSIGLEAPLEGALGVSIDFAATRPKTTKLLCPKGDIDNFLKSALDAFNGLLWEDDHCIVHIEGAKRWAPRGDEGFIDIFVAQLAP